MSEIDQYLPQIKNLVNRYSEIDKLTQSLIERVNLLNLEKQQIELKLAEAREDERKLIDTIKNDTGKDLDLYEVFKKVINT